MRYPILFFCCLIFFSQLQAVELPNLFSSNMVLQQDKPIKIWGKAQPNGSLLVAFDQDEKSVQVEGSGKWLVTFPARKSGGPFQIRIQEGDTTIVLQNVMIGEVWVCSGQSNMEWPVSRVRDAEKEIAAADYANIRIFDVPRKMAGEPQYDTEPAEWKAVTPQTISAFSAVAYFFGRKLHRDLDVPIGLINSSWGGTEVEAWTSGKALRENDLFENELDILEKSEIEKMKEERESLLQEWRKELLAQDKGFGDGGFVWNNPAIDDQWKLAQVPGEWQEFIGKDFDGVVWYATRFELGKVPEGTAKLYLGKIDDSDQTFINGQEVGSTWDRYNRTRVYDVNSSVLEEGENTLVVRVEDYRGGGGFTSDQPKLSWGIPATEVDFKDWYYRVGLDQLPPMPEAMTRRNGPNDFASSLYNGMIAPLTPLPIQGFTWYQGESNAGSFDRAQQYEKLFSLMITDWRSWWNDEDLPFLYVQLANFLAPDAQPKDDPWPFLRESQLEVLKLPQTAMASAIDIGEADDIHPRNKQDVGERLALAALKLAYDKDITYMGPIYQGVEINGSEALVSFDHVGIGLESGSKYDYVAGFTVAGSDHVFHYAQAEIVDRNTVRVYSDKVDNIEAVRYGWANNPDEANLYNAAGLPASPFRTDGWEPKK